MTLRAHSSLSKMQCSAKRLAVMIIIILHATLWDTQRSSYLCVEFCIEPFTHEGSILIQESIQALPNTGNKLGLCGFCHYKGNSLIAPCKLLFCLTCAVSNRFSNTWTVLGM